MAESTSPFIETGEATAILPLPNDQKPVTVIGTPAIRETFDAGCIKQTINSAMAPWSSSGTSAAMRLSGNQAPVPAARWMPDSR